MKYKFCIGNRIGTILNITTNDKSTYTIIKRIKLFKDVAFEIVT